MSTATRDSLMPVGQAAARLGVSAERVRQLVDAGRLPAVRGPYAMRLIPAEAVERMAAERERTSGRGRDR